MVPIKSGQPRQSFFIFESAVALVSGFACSPPPVLCLPLSLSNAAHTPTHARTFSPSFYHQLSRTRDHQSLLQKTVEREEEEEEEEEETEKKRVASMGIKGMIDLEKHYSFYGAYHRHRVNVLMHTLFVWPLFFSFLVLFYFTPPIFSLFLSLLPENLLTSHGLVLNFGFLLALIYAVTYVCLDWKAGSLAALLCFAFWVGASLLAQQLGFSLAWKFFLASQVICWAGQSIGHGVFEVSRYT
ncbi:hypothetical protein EUGRSUZ_K02488 [Eucalyptus grandis]|uniref:Uncharacterized protein n=2 Tax=Eucalyptus grandis TaxID=71139 RepID=A0ACC3IWR4_EUCGR|nr:hypothetical protein EUGRSUZ_K02488 [Eucalyptus grandis]